MTNKQNLQVTFTKLSDELVDQLERKIVERTDEDLDSDVLELLQLLIASHDVAWAELDEVQKKHDAIIQALNDCRDTPGFVFAADVFDWLESTSPFLKEGL